MKEDLPLFIFSDILCVHLMCEMNFNFSIDMAFKCYGFEIISDKV